MERFLVHNPLDIRLDLGTQPHYKAPGNVQVKIVETLWFTLGESGISSIIAQSWPWENQIKVKKKMMKKLMKRLRFIKKKVKIFHPTKERSLKSKTFPSGIFSPLFLGATISTFTQHEISRTYIHKITKTISHYKLRHPFKQKRFMKLQFAYCKKIDWALPLLLRLK